MNLSRLMLLPIVVAAMLVTGARAEEPLYKNDFESAEVGKTPAGMLVVAGDFTVQQGKEGKYLELPGEPLDSFGLIFGPSVKDNVTASARFFGTKKGRKYPAFGLSLNGVGGYRLQVSAAKGQLEFFKGDESKLSVPFTWTPDTWTMLRINVRKSGAGWTVEGKAWVAGTPEPAKPMISTPEEKEPSAGRAGLWGSPFAGTPIRFDDLLIEALK